MLNSFSSDGTFSRRTPVGNAIETFGATLGSHIQCSGTALLTMVEEQLDQDRGTVRLRIHCFQDGSNWERAFLTELEAIAALIGYHGGHEGHHLAFRVNRRDWLIACSDHGESDLPEGE